MIRILAAAKINLALDVIKKREDGYHEVDMVMQSVGLYDELLFHEKDRITLSVDGGAPAGEDNLVFRAACLLKAETGCAKGAAITLRKKIPIAAGLAGGSADAAATLAGLSVLWGLHLSTDALQAIGAKLGADIPFCLVGGTMRATGIGTTLRPLTPPPSMFLLIDRPCNGMLTREVYGGLRLDASLQHPNVDGMEVALSCGNYADLLSCAGNILESVTLPARPQAAAAIRRLIDCGADAARMTGSGPAVFGIFHDEQTARAAQLCYGGGYLCVPVQSGLSIIYE